MNKYCEFCVNLRSVIYCKADAAYLCLSCDIKVHSANPLSKRHYRTIICESCNRRPTHVRCYDHKMFMCRGCDQNQHDASSQHRKRVVNSYVGCPSAQDLGALWGFDLNRFVEGNELGSSSSLSSNTSVVGLETGTSGSINEDIKAIYGGIQNENAFSVLQQLVDLLKVQISEVSYISSLTRHQEQNLDNDFDHFSQLSVLGMVHHHHHDTNLDPCLLPFAQLDPLASSQTGESSLQESPFWQCKSPIHSGQLWSHNMQDLGVCEEPSCLDELNIPDIDLTFKNFEELFRTDQEPISNNTEDTLMATSFAIVESSPKKARYASQIISFSHSRLSGETSGTECIDSGTWPSCGSPEQNESTKSKGKKNIQLKEDQCGYRKARSDTRKQVKSQRWKLEIQESTTKSF